MPNQPENSSNYIFLRRRFNFLMILFMAIVTGFILFIFVHDWNKTSPEEKALKIQLNAVNKSLDSLKKGYKILQENGENLNVRLGMLRFEKDEIFRRVIDSENKLATIKKGYEKINAYTDINIDSLHGIFSTRFKNRQR